MGFEVRSAVAFAGPSASPNVHRAEATDAGGDILALEYGPAATIWRINVGWRRRKPTAPLGFVLDTERGFWQKNDLDPDDKDDPMSGKTERVVPYVEDRRNVLLVTPATELSTEEMASLAAALKNAIQVEFQLEDAELASEALPSRRQAQRDPVLRGGRGRRRRPAPARPRARRPARGRAPGARALPLRSRHGRGPRWSAERQGGLRGRLLRLPPLVRQPARPPAARPQEDRGDSCFGSRRRPCASPTRRTPPRSTCRKLKALAGSNLERKWLDFLAARGHALPTAAQKAIPGIYARPDFQYGASVVVFIDGPVHDYPNIAERDAGIRAALEDAGYLVIAFGMTEAEWPAVLAKYPNVFGKPVGGGS